MTRRGQPPTRGKAGKGGTAPEPSLPTETGIHFDAEKLAQPGPVAIPKTEPAFAYQPQPTGAAGVIETSGECVGEDEERAPDLGDGTAEAVLTAQGASRARARKDVPTLDDAVQELWNLYEMCVGGLTHRWPERDGSMREMQKEDAKAALATFDRLMALGGLIAAPGAKLTTLGVADDPNEAGRIGRVLDAIAAHPEMRAEMVRRLEGKK